MTSSMAWYPLPQTGGTVSAGDEFFETHSAGWSLWSFSASDDPNATTGVVCSVLKQEHDGDAPCSTGSPEEDQPSSEGPAAPVDVLLQHGPAEDIFLSQFSDEEMRRMDDDAPFEALDMFPDSMHRLLSYENMLSGVLTGSEQEGGGDADLLDHDGVDTMDTCGFPLFSHDLQNGSWNAEQSTTSNPEVMVPGCPPSEEEEEEDKAVLRTMTKRSRAVTGAERESTPGFEAVVLEELEGVVFQLTKRARICYRDAFYRLAESSKANCSSSRRQSSRQHLDGDGSASRFSTAPGCPERETNPIDRTVMVLTMKPPPRQLHGNCCCADDSAGAEEAQSTTSWTTRA